MKKKLTHIEGQLLYHFPAVRQDSGENYFFPLKKSLVFSASTSCSEKT